MMIITIFQTKIVFKKKVNSNPNGIMSMGKICPKHNHLSLINCNMNNNQFLSKNQKEILNLEVIIACLNQELQ